MGTERFFNNYFETNSYWFAPITAYTAGYSYLFNYTLGGFRSMRTGIYYASHNKYSYSDFREAAPVYIPVGASSAYISFYMYRLSGEPDTLAVPEIPTLESGKLELSPESGDVQYLLVLDQWQNWIGTLLWGRKNNPTWVYRIYDLMAYRGMSIYLQFGTYNNGYSGVTSMFIDDVSLCTVP